MNALKQAFAPLSKIGRDEVAFEIGGQQITLAPLLPRDEVEVQKYASGILTDIQVEEGLDDAAGMSRASALDYLDRFRTEIIANAIVQINDLDLRDIETLETGETLPNGTPVRIPRRKAMREIVQGWSRAMLTICFSRYGELLQKIADEAEVLASETVADLDVEIDRVESRLARLRDERDMRAKGDPSVTARQIQGLISADKALRAEAEAASEVAADMARTRREKGTSAPEPTPEPSPEPTPEPQTEARRSVIPPTAPPPTAAPPPPEPDLAEAMFTSSFGDPGDPEPVISDEERRITEARRAAREARAANPPPSVDPLRDAKPVGTLGGLDAYRLPSEEVSPRGRPANPEAHKQQSKDVSFDPTRGTENPNFKPPE